MEQKNLNWMEIKIEHSDLIAEPLHSDLFTRICLGNFFISVDAVSVFASSFVWS